MSKAKTHGQSKSVVNWINNGYDEIEAKEERIKALASGKAVTGIEPEHQTIEQLEGDIEKTRQGRVERAEREGLPEILKNEIGTRRVLKRPKTR